MTDHITYPTEWPGHCIARLIEIGPGGLIDRKAEAIKSAYTLVGFFAGKMLGDPDVEPLMSVADATELQTERNTQAADMVHLISVYGMAYDKTLASGPVTNALIERLIAIILPILLEWLEEWLTNKDET